MVVVVVAGLLGVVLARGGDEAAAGPPTQADHWHAAFAVNVCGEWLPNPAAFDYVSGTNVIAGIHTHGDGFIHIHPRSAAETGDNATLGRFLENGGWSASEDSIEVWTGPSFDRAKTKWSNGDRCPDDAGRAGMGKPGRVVFEVNCRPVAGDPSDHKLADQEVVAIGFLPKGQEMGAPPNAASAPESDDGRPTSAISQAGCRPSAENNPGASPSTTISTFATTPTTQQ
jgi:hypothetical protein